MPFQQSISITHQGFLLFLSIRAFLTLMEIIYPSRLNVLQPKKVLFSRWFFSLKFHFVTLQLPLFGLWKWKASTSDNTRPLSTIPRTGYLSTSNWLIFCNTTNWLGANITSKWLIVYNTTNWSVVRNTLTWLIVYKTSNRLGICIVCN